MHPVSFCVGRKPEEKGSVDIVICVFNIRIGMVQDIVLYFPYGGIGPDKVHGVTQPGVQPGMFRISPVDGIVHDPHADAGHSQPAAGVKDEQQPYGSNQPCIDQYKGHKKQGEHEGCFKKHAVVAVFAEVPGFKIGIYPASEGSGKLAACSFCILRDIDTAII